MRSSRHYVLVCSFVAMLFVLLVSETHNVSAQDCNYSVRAGSWLNTGVSVKRGQKVEITATGTLRYAEGSRVEFGAGGDSYGIWSLKGKIGNQIEIVGGKGSFTANSDGTLELGVPAKADIPVQQSANELDPSYHLCASVNVSGPGGTGSGGSGGGGGGGTGGSDDRLSAFMYWCADELVAGAEPSEPCTICIQNWRLSNSGGGNMVVQFPLNTSSWGDQSNGLRVFAGGFANDPISRWEGAIWDWGGYSCSKHPPDSSVVAGGSPAGEIKREYPWGFLVSAPRGTLPGVRDLPVTISQVNGGSVSLNLRVNVVASKSRGPAAGIPTGRFAIITANDRNAITAVGGGGIGRSGALNSDALDVDDWEIFVLEPLSDGNYAIKTINGNYLTAMRGGGLTGADVIHTDARRVDAWEKFRIEPQADGTFAIRTINGNYLTAVNGGGVGGGRGAIHSNATSVSGWEKFRLISLGLQDLQQRPTLTTTPQKQQPKNDGTSRGGNVVNVDWSRGAPYVGQNIRVTYNCPPGGGANLGTVWGTDLYTYDSSVCIAAVHAGLITFANGGRVTFEMRPGASRYPGTTRNGVASKEWGAYGGSFAFVP